MLQIITPDLNDDVGALGKRIDFRVISWLYRARIPLVIALGAFDAWAGRGSFVAGDTVGYMDIARSLALGDFSRAINGCWSPLYPAILSLFIRPFIEDPVGQFAAVRVANFIIFVATVGLFEFLLRQLQARRQGTVQAEASEWTALPHQCFVVAAYAAFVWACFGLNIVSRISPDNLVLAMQLLSISILLSLDTDPVLLRKFILFGVVLGIGYWIKTILFPAGVIFLAIAALAPALRGRKRFLFLSASAFLVVIAPLVIAMSLHCNRLTFGETGRLNYAWFVNNVPFNRHWQGGVPDQGTPKHTTRKIHSKPDVFEFATPFDSTYPPWTEPTYWYEGVETHVNLRQQAVAIYLNCRRLARIVVEGALIPVLLLVLVFAWWGARRWNDLRRTLQTMLPFWLFALPFIALYMLIFVEPRYIAGPLLLVSVALIALIRAKRAHWAARIALLLMAAGIGSVAPRLGAAAHRVIVQRGNTLDNRWTVHQEFTRLGLPLRTPVASIGLVAFDDWAYAAQARVVTEITSYNNGGRTGDVEAFWQSSRDEQRRVLELMRNAGAKVVVCTEVPAGVTAEGWTQISDSAYFYVDLRVAAP